MSRPSRRLRTLDLLNLAQMWNPADQCSPELSRIKDGDEGFSAHSGCYSLVISLRKKKWIRVGSLGRARFPSGIYLYTGSAMNSLWGRLSRHLRKRNKKNHWHIDYLLKCPEADIKRVMIYPTATRQECSLNQRIAKFPAAKVILKRFGASDCISGCSSHLFYFSLTPRLETLAHGSKSFLVPFHRRERAIAYGKSFRRYVWRR